MTSTKSPNRPRTSRKDRRAFPRKRISDEVGGHGNGSEMGWLVSYADMMTLLFGLFVILYVLAAKKHSELQHSMTQIAVKYFDATPKPEAPPSPQTATPSAPVELKASAQLAEDQKEIAEKADKIEKLTAMIAALETKTDTLEGELKTNAKKEKSSAADPTPSLKHQLTNVEHKLETATGELTQLREQNETLKSEMAAEKASVQTFMMVMVTWETEKHDIDLRLTDPNAKAFDFKHREIAGEPGRFELDSRLGPGIEMWKAQNFIPGAYKTEMQLYSMNGNKNPARAHLSIITNHTTYNSKSFELKSAGQRKTITFQVTDKGEVQIAGGEGE